MASFSYLILYLSIVSTPFVTALAPQYQSSAHVARQDADTPYITTGLGQPGAAPGVRPEIRDFEQRTDEYNIYLLGVQRLQQTSQDDLLSWYQVLGIHGRPFKPWNNVQAAPGMNGTGYCHHFSQMFPPWHRPYLALYEQILFSLMQDVVAEFPAGPQQDRYANAIANFRMPYWDWALTLEPGAIGMPDSLLLPTRNVITPQGPQVIPNPLFRYDFHPLDPIDLPDAPYNLWPHTLRHPTSNTSANATTQPYQVVDEVNANRDILRSRLYNLFTTYTDYYYFGTKIWLAQALQFNPFLAGGSYDSLENVHDEIHLMMGAGGHMSVTDYASFDPVFILHHTNIDRLWSLWTYIWPETYVTPSPSAYGTFTVEVNETVNLDTNLTPFWRNETTFWKLRDVLYPDILGYTYPDFPNTSDPWDVRTAQAKALVNKLYNDNATNNSSGGCYSEYRADIRVARDAIPGSFSIFVFLGSYASADASTWRQDYNHVGAFGVFKRAVPVGPLSKIVTSGSVPLTSALSDRVSSGKLSSLDDDDVAAYLSKNIHWAVATVDGTIIDNNLVDGLKVSVVKSTLTAADDADSFPKLGESTILAEVTAGKAGGYKSGDNY